MAVICACAAAKVIAGLEAADDVRAVAVPAFAHELLVEERAERHEEVGAAVKAKTGGQDAGHAGRHAVEQHGLADDLRIAREEALPGRMRQPHDAVRRPARSSSAVRSRPWAACTPTAGKKSAETCAIEICSALSGVLSLHPSVR